MDKLFVPSHAIDEVLVILIHFPQEKDFAATRVIFP